MVISSDENIGPRRCVGPALALVIWSALSYSRTVDALILPSPGRVLAAVFDIGPTLWLHITATLVRILLGFGTSLILGCIVGILMQYSRTCYVLLDGVIESWRPVPPVALVPFFVLVFGFSESGRLLIVVLGSSLVIIVTVLEALARVAPAIVRFGLVAGFSRGALFWNVLIPAGLPHMRAGFRIALALSISIVVVSEFLGARFGLGYLISVSRVTLSTPTIFLCVGLLGVVGSLLDLGLRRLMDALTKHQPSTREAIR